MNTRILTAIACMALGALGGFVTGRITAPAAMAPSAKASENPVASTAAGSLSPETTTGTTQALTPSPVGVPKAITASELQGILASMEKPGSGGMGDLRKMADLQDRLKVSDLGSIAAAMCASPIAPNQMSGFYLVMSSYAEKDPQAAWNLVIGTKGRTRQYALPAIISSLAAKDPSRALALADSVEDTQLKSQLRSSAIMKVAQDDPQKALSLALSSKGGEQRDFSVSMIFGAWAQKDIEGAKAAVARLSGRQAEQARQALVLNLAQHDPKAAWEYASTLPLTNSRNPYGDPRLQVIQNWAQSNPQAALKAALTIGESAQRGQAIATAVNAWAGTDFAAALNYAVSFEDPGIRGNILQSLTQSTNGNRKELLQAVLEHVPPGDTFQQAVSNVFSSWARENPSAAAAAAMQLPAGRTFSNVASQIASQWTSSTTNKQEVFDWVRSLPAGEARSNSIRSIFARWSGDDPQAAARALSDLTSEDRKMALQSVASGWGRISPDAALKWSSSLPDPDERTSAVRSVISQWSDSAPEAAARYVVTLPESERAGSLENIVNNWASKDSESAAAWLDKQPAGPSKDGALRALSRKIAQEDPEAALTWVAGISNDRDRLRQTEQIARDWIRQDPATAKAWIASSKLPEETRNNLLK